MNQEGGGAINFTSGVFEYYLCGTQATHQYSPRTINLAIKLKQ